MRLLSVFVLLAIVTAATAPAFAEKQYPDDQIYDQVRRRLASDRDVKGGGIDVDVKQGIVVLRGKVHEEKQKSRAEHIARRVKGVKKVVNELQIELAPGVPAPAK